MKHKIHTHPRMEQELNVPQDHCIVDKKALEEINNIRDDYKISQANQCDECLSEDIEYGKGYRICKNCGKSLDTGNIIWG